MPKKTQWQKILIGSFIKKKHVKLWRPGYRRSPSISNSKTQSLLGQLPSGYAYEAASRSKAVHRLPTPPKALGENNYANILQNILKFFDATDSRSLPPMFTDNDQVPVVKSIIEQLCKDSYEDPLNFRVYPIAQLFFVLKGETSKYTLDEAGAFFSVHIAQTMIDRDQYDYRSNIACAVRIDINKVSCPIMNTYFFLFLFI